MICYLDIHTMYEYTYQQSIVLKCMLFIIMHIKNIHCTVCPSWTLLVEINSMIYITCLSYYRIYNTCCRLSFIMRSGTGVGACTCTDLGVDVGLFYISVYVYVYVIVIVRVLVMVMVVLQIFKQLIN